jgi:hypothetical protein
MTDLDILVRHCTQQALDGKLNGSPLMASTTEQAERPNVIQLDPRRPTRLDTVH